MPASAGLKQSLGGGRLRGMKVTATTPDHLILQSRPWALGGLLILLTLVVAALALGLASQGEWAGATMMGLGVLAMVGAFTAFVRREIAIFDRTTGLVTVRARSLLGGTERIVTLDQIGGVIVQNSTRRKAGAAPTHRPALTLKDGATLPLMEAYYSGRGADQAAAAVKGWLSA